MGLYLGRTGFCFLPGERMSKLLISLDFDLDLEVEFFLDLSDDPGLSRRDLEIREEPRAIDGLREMDGLLEIDGLRESRR